MHHKSLNSKNYRTALTKLASTDKDLKSVLDLHGPPPMWSRDPGFPTLIYIVLEQQVSLASARATFERLNKSLPEFIPNNFLKLDNLTLRKIGFRLSKYCHRRRRRIITN
jgi:DNA-3-methyladenine glycosylase II